ncbi:MAG: hypothetical protein WC712_12975 [Candidatus Brocadiia bacterium]
MKVRFAFVSALVLALCLPFAAPLFAEENDDAAREEAKKTIMYPWSKDAHTADLKLGPEATKMVDLYLDRCRNDYARRAKPSEMFMGNAHEIWETKDGVIDFHVDFVVLVIDRAPLPIAMAPVVASAFLAKDFVEKVKVEGDKDELLRLWGLMLASEVADIADAYTGRPEYAEFVKKGGKALDKEARAKAWQAAFDFLVAGFDATKPITDQYPMPGSIESERFTFLSAIRIFGGEKAVPELKKIYEKRAKAGKTEILAIAQAIAKCPGKEAEQFMVGELDSGEPDRINNVIYIIPLTASKAIVEKIGKLLMDTEDRNLQSNCISILERLSGKDAAQADVAAGILIKAFAEFEEGAKYSIACSLIRSGKYTPEVVAFMRELLKSLEEDDPNDNRIPYIKEMLKTVK